MIGDSDKNSPNMEIHAILNEQLTILQNLIETFLHEAFGHTLLYIRTHNRKRSGHNYNKTGGDDNEELQQYIKESIDEYQNEYP